jgi:type III secretory pathway component EscV
LNENSVSNSANIVTNFPIKVRKTIATFDIALASLCVLARVFSKGYSGLVLSTLFLLFSVYFTFENEIKKMSKKNKNKKNDGTNDSKNDNSSSSTSNNAAPA